MTEAPAAAAAAPAHAAPAGPAPVEPEDTVFSLPLSHVTHDISDAEPITRMPRRMPYGGNAPIGVHTAAEQPTASRRQRPAPAHFAEPVAAAINESTAVFAVTRARRAGVSRSSSIRRSIRVRFCTGTRGGALPRDRIGARSHIDCSRRRAHSNDGRCLPAPQHARVLRDARARRRRPARR